MPEPVLSGAWLLWIFLKYLKGVTVTVLKIRKSPGQGHDALPFSSWTLGHCKKWYQYLVINLNFWQIKKSVLFCLGRKMTFLSLHSCNWEIEINIAPKWRFRLEICDRVKARTCLLLTGDWFEMYFPSWWVMKWKPSRQEFIFIAKIVCGVGKNN